MNRLNGSQRIYLLTLAIGLAALIGCVPMHTVTRPTLDDVRLGRAAGAPAEDLARRPNEVRAEVLQVEPERNQIRVRTDDGRREVHKRASSLVGLQSTSTLAPIVSHADSARLR